MGFKVEFETSNAAFEEDINGEISRILADLADQFQDNGGLPVGPGIETGKLWDVNGNMVGKWTYRP